MSENPCHFCEYDLEGVPLQEGSPPGRKCPECGNVSPPGPRVKLMMDLNRWRVPVVISAPLIVCLAVAVARVAPDALAIGVVVVIGSAAIGVLTGVLSAMWWTMVLTLGPESQPPSVAENVWRIVFRSTIIALFAAVLGFCVGVCVAFAVLVAR